MLIILCCKIIFGFLPTIWFWHSSVILRTSLTCYVLLVLVAISRGVSTSCNCILFLHTHLTELSLLLFSMPQKYNPSDLHTAGGKKKMVSYDLLQFFLIFWDFFKRISLLCTRLIACTRLSSSLRNSVHCERVLVQARGCRFDARSFPKWSSFLWTKNNHG